MSKVKTIRVGGFECSAMGIEQMRLKLCQWVLGCARNYYGKWAEEVLYQN